MELPKIIVDTREQEPFQFKGWPCLRRGLKTGDYSLKGYERRFAIERKSLEDLWSTLTVQENYSRFRQELGRAQASCLSLSVLVEATPVRIAQTSHAYSKANGFKVLDKFLRVCLEFGVAPLFGTDRSGAELLALATLKAYHSAAKDGVLGAA